MTTRLSDIAAGLVVPITGILHIGAGELEEAEEYQQMGLGCVWWIEARPHDEAREERARSFGHVLLEDTALSDRASIADFHLASNYLSSSLLPLAGHAVLRPDITILKVNKVKTIRGDSLLAASLPREINTLVLDVQGAELKVLQGLGSILKRIRYAFIEVSIKELYRGQPLIGEVEKWMVQHRFPSHTYHEVIPGEFGNEFFMR